jgi:ATPase subunit of ABC transporter with duplicated ATPase domains
MASDDGDGDDHDHDGTKNEEKQKNKKSDDDYLAPLKLTQKVVLKDHDIKSFASGLSADGPTIDHEDGALSSIASYYANMIDISENDAAISERKRRKERQKAIREELENGERQRALQQAMDILNDDNMDDNENPEELLSAAKDNSADVHLKNFDLPNLRGGGPDLLQNVSLTLAKGRRYGLMGRNGCGKTTFMTFLAQREIQDAIPKKMSMVLVRQETIGNKLSALDMVLKSDVRREGVKKFISWCERELDRLENGCESKEEHEQGNNDDNIDSTNEKKISKGKQKLLERKKEKMRKAARAKVGGSKAVSKVKVKNIEHQKNKLSEKLGKAYQKLNEIEEEEGGDPEPRAIKILTGIGFSDEMRNKPTSELSGGWRMRVSIACGIFANPSLLLLDEPTNHLDLESCLWLEKYLTNYFTGTLLVVSHDRHFLNEVVTDVVYFNRNNLTTYRGDITNWETVREDEKQRQIRLRENQEAKKAHLQKYIDLHSQAGENGPKASRQRKSKMKKMEKVGMMAQEGKRYKASYDGDAEEVEEFVEDEIVTLQFPDPGTFDGNIVTLDQVAFGYTDSNILLNNVDLSINIKSRVALLGRNGQGKSTLIKLVTGALRPLKGQAKINGRAKIEYLAQHQFEDLDPDSTPIQTMIERYPGDQSNDHILSLRRYLANFGLGGEVLPKQRIYTMSGGQKCRLCLASAMYRKPHLLVLDEPTNHLDFETIEALIEAIRDFNGGVLIVSHDQHLLTSVCKDLYAVDKGKLELLRHGLDNKDAFQQYKKDVVAGRR